MLDVRIRARDNDLMLSHGCGLLSYMSQHCYKDVELRN